MSRQLSANAEKIVDEIRNIIPETASKDSFISKRVFRLTAENRDIMYGGELLTEKVGSLVQELKIPKDWGWAIWHFPLGRTIINKNSAMYIVPLPDKKLIPSEGVSNNLIFTTDDAKFNPYDTALIFMK
ncbi:uncharacterized protein ATNIH1004_011776 [Aspergillus tanneri]|uniref:Uncharacterized protein n=1 Tax=Aspergillus tanneri TaxID=1220188 RepID=A0A5M9M808_9EURO|nr:uncharacterized protein ATNIH1004_011776 [Aspergillus tanneri]KAA8641640.1 hypothetical protein ATNIH1004_011776 [Aspergillus tanneri]